MTAFKSILTIMGLALITGCASPLKNYPGFPDYSRTITKAQCIVDVAALRDVSGSVDELNVSNNAVLAAAVLEKLMTELESKGYHLSDSSIVSVGAGITNQSFTVIGTDGTAYPSNAPLPFVISGKTLDADTLKSAHVGLNGYVKSTEEPSKQIPEVANLKTGDEDAAFVVSVEGRSVALNKALGQAAVTAVLTLGHAAVWQTTYITMRLNVVDTSTGELVWADSQFIKGGTIDVKGLSSLFERMMRRLPAKQEVEPESEGPDHSLHVP